MTIRVDELPDEVGLGSSREATEARTDRRVLEHRAFFEHAPEALLVVDRTGSLVDANRAARELLAPDHSTLRGRPLRAFFDLRGASAEPAVCFETMARSGVCPEGRELRLSSGASVQLCARVLPGDDAPGVVSLRVVSFSQKQQELERMAAVGRLASSVAHEVNNSLAVLELGLDALLSSGLSRADADERLQQSAEHARRIARIVEGLGQVARSRSAVQRDVLVRNLIESALGRLRLARSGLEVSIDLQPSSLTVVVDKNQIEQALANVLAHAVSSDPRRAKLEVRARAAQGACSITVGDPTGLARSGAGEPLSPVADPKTGDRSVALDLSVAWSLVADNAGVLRAGKGRAGAPSVEMMLPLSTHSTKQGPASEEAGEASGAMHVLCVEDEPALRVLLVAMLRDIGHVAYAADSAERALEILGQRSVDAVLADVQLPGQSGEVLAEAIREAYPTLEQRVILMSGMFCEVPPGQPWLQKPFTFDELAQALDALVSG